MHCFTMVVLHVQFILYSGVEMGGGGETPYGHGILRGQKFLVCLWCVLSRKLNSVF